MKAQRSPSVGVAIMSSALLVVRRLSPVVATTTASSAACVETSISDGFCDDTNNNEGCGYDGGDCCSCTCVSGNFLCGENIGFACLDPSASCFDDNSTSESPPCNPDYFSDGDCDLINNTDECGYDGGDCCECTCVSTGYFTCGDSSHGGFSCIDPSAPCVDDDDATTLPTPETFTGTSTTTSPTGPCAPDFVSDGDCDLINNTEECGYDGGDCCACTCVSTDYFTCGDGSNGGFTCLDPRAPCVDDDDATTLPTTETFTETSTTTTATGPCAPDFVSDGDCDLINNTEECGYDGGDCCECTCVSTDDFTCGDGSNGGFTCLDPRAPCVDDDDATTLPTTETFTGTSTTTSTTLSCIPGFVSDGDCDLINNTEECGYDGGDCCECTCVSTDYFTCGDGGNGGFTCLDPSAPCVDDDDATTLPTTETFTGTPTTTSTTRPCFPEFVSDGDCDLINNNEGCGYDGGDCCECTCVSTTAFTCGDEDDGGFACLDPSAPCVDDDDFIPDDDYYFDDEDELSGSFAFEPCLDDFIGDGDCDPTNNNEGCGFDGGDCCECTCVSTFAFTCGVNGFDCVDPSASCSDGYVEAGTTTTVGVSANGYDMRPGIAGGDVGCQLDGCAPALTRDGISDDSESRWSCSQSIVPNESQCSIEFTFEEPQDIVDVMVAFWMSDEFSRTLQVSVNGESIGRFTSQPGSTFTALGIVMNGVGTLEFEAVGLDSSEWIDISEVLFLVEP